jgi:hypothetical protein
LSALSRLGYKDETMHDTGRRRLVFATLGAVGLLAAYLWLGRSADEPASVAEAPAPAPLDAPTPFASDRVEEPQPDESPSGAPAVSPMPDPLPGLGDGDGTAWAAVDLDEVRRALPDNLYWQTSVPTTDLRELDRRAEERERWNVEYGKVLSNTATEQEIEAYYAHRQRVSEDAVEFANYLLNRYGDELPPRDVGLLELAIELHLGRLEEIPRQIADAHRRREAHEAARQAWLEEQAAFEAGVDPDGE